jgi:hypothetical protein
MEAVRWLTYEEVADTLGIGRESARVIAKRKRWPRRAGNDRKARIGVPEEVIASRNMMGNASGDSSDNPSGNDAPTVPPTVPEHDLQQARIDIARLEARIDALSAILDAERRMFAEAVQEARAERDRWHAQAERLAIAPPQAARRWWPWRRSY